MDVFLDLCVRTSVILGRQCSESVIAVNMNGRAVVTLRPPSIPVVSSSGTPADMGPHSTTYTTVAKGKRERCMLRTFLGELAREVVGLRAERDGRRRDVRVLRELLVEEFRARCASESPQLQIDVRALRVHRVHDLLASS